MRSTKEQIVAIEAELVTLDKRIDSISEKRDQLQNRLLKLDQRRKPLQQKLEGALDRLFLDEHKARRQNDPEEGRRFLNFMGPSLTTDRQREHFGLPPKGATSTEADSTQTADEAATVEPQASGSSVEGDAASAEPQTPQRTATEPAGSVEPQPPGSSAETDSKSVEPQAPQRTATEGAEPVEPQASESSVESEDPSARQSSTDTAPTDSAPAKPSPPLASKKQLTYLKDLIRANPVAAKKFSLDPASLDSMTRAAASRAIKRLLNAKPSESSRDAADPGAAGDQTADVP